MTDIEKMKNIEKMNEIMTNKAKLDEVCRECFNFANTDHSGFIDRKELKVVVNHITDKLKIPITADEAKDMFDHLDVDKSGKLDYDEFTKLTFEVLETIANRLTC